MMASAIARPIPDRFGEQLGDKTRTRDAGQNAYWQARCHRVGNSNRDQHRRQHEPSEDIVPKPRRLVSTQRFRFPAASASNASLAVTSRAARQRAETSVVVGNRLAGAQTLGSIFGPPLRLGNLRQVYVDLLVWDTVEQMPDQV
jgi:hypothetical protein